MVSALIPVESDRKKTGTAGRSEAKDLSWGNAARFSPAG